MLCSRLLADMKRRCGGLYWQQAAALANGSSMGKGLGGDGRQRGAETGA